MTDDMVHANHVPGDAACHYRVLLADDHAIVRAGLRAIIEAQAEFEVVAMVSDGREAEREVRRLVPDMALIDLSMPGLNGLDAIERIARHTPATRAIALSMHASEHYLREALRLGAWGYVVKDTAASELVTALRAVAAGRRYLSPQLAGRMALPAAGDGVAEAVLSSRQREVLQLIAEGYSTRDIAARLCISVKTVETHRAEIMRRLSLFDVASLTRYALRIGLVQDGR